VFGWLLRLFGRGRKAEIAPIREEEAYAHSYGDRTGDIVVVERVPEPEPEPESSPFEDGELTGESLRRAFEKKLEERKKLTT
jgi:hypothetical protein